MMMMIPITPRTWNALMAAKTFAMAAVSSAAQAKFISPKDAKTSRKRKASPPWAKFGKKMGNFINNYGLLYL